MRKSKFIIIKGFYTNLSEFDIENILIENSVFDSYRAIAGASQLLKLFEYVILIVWGDDLETDSMQFVFKKGSQQHSAPG